MSSMRRSETPEAAARRRARESAQRTQRASPFQVSGAGSRRDASSVDAIRRRLVEAVDGFVHEPHSPSRLYALFLAHFEWRRLTRLEYGAARRKGDEGRCRALRERERRE